MKKIFLRITMLVLTLAMLVGLSGCSWFTIQLPNDNSGLPSGTPNVGALTELPDSIAQAESVTVKTFTPEERVDTPLTVLETVSMVKRSSVAIRTDTGSGSGTIIDVDDGVNAKNTFYVLTCHHVINAASTIMITVPDLNYRYGENPDYSFMGTIGGERVENQAVSLVGGDYKSDVAVLKLYIANDDIASNIYKAKIMSKDYSLTEGEKIIAIGNPTGQLPGSVTDGVVGYVNRTANIGDIGNMVLTQISVTINPGSSGGSLFNTYGELCGITSAGNAANMTYYAIPHRIAENAKEDKGFINIAEQLIATCTKDNYGYVSGRKQVIGFAFSQVSSTVGGESYLMITDVQSGSTAQKNGLLVGDIITHIETGGNKKRLTTVKECSAIIDALNPGDKFKFYITRESGDTTVEFTIYQEYFKDTGVYPTDNE